MIHRKLTGEILQQLVAIWQCEQSKISWHGDGFDWVPGSHLVKVRAFEKESDRGERVRLSIATDFLQNVPVEEKAFTRRLDAGAHFMTSTYSLVYPPAVR